MDGLAVIEFERRLAGEHHDIVDCVSAVHARVVHLRHVHGARQLLVDLSHRRRHVKIGGGGRPSFAFWGATPQPCHRTSNSLTGSSNPRNSVSPRSPNMNSLPFVSCLTTS